MKILKRIFCSTLMCTVFLSMFVPIASAFTADACKHVYFKHAIFGDSYEGTYDNVQAHYIGNKDKNGNFINAQTVYCLERGVPVGMVPKPTWNGEGLIMNSTYWRSLSQAQQNAVIRTLLHGYPNCNKNYGTGAKTNDMIYGTQVLLWEFVTGARSPYDYSLNGAAEKKYRFRYAFLGRKESSPNGDLSLSETSGRGTMESGMESSIFNDYNLRFSKARAYHDKLIETVKNHTSKPSNAKSEYVITGVGKHTYTLTNAGDYNFIVVSPAGSKDIVITGSGNTLTIDVKKACKRVLVKAVAKDTVIQSKYSIPVIIETGKDKQKLMYGVLEDPGQFGLWVQAAPNHGGLGVVKEDSLGNPVQGVKFGVYRSNSDAAKDTNRLETMVTNAEGWGQYGYGYGTLFNLPADSYYYVKELVQSNGKPYGNNNLIADTKIYKVKIYAGYWSLINGGVLSNGQANATTIGYKNGDLANKKKGKLEIYTSVDGVEKGNFKICMFNEQTDAKTYTNTVATLISDSKGLVQKDNLTPGYYDLRIQAVPEDSKGNDIVVQSGCIIPIMINENMVTKVYLRYQNGRVSVVNETSGAIGVSKTDKKGNPLSGATFGVYATKTDAEKNTNRKSSITTNSYGIATYGGTDFSNFSLKPNTTFYFKETKAPAGYVVNNTVISATVESGCLVFASSNSSKTNITYRDLGGYSDNTRYIKVNTDSGAKINLYNSGGSLVKTYTANGNGEVNTYSDSLKSGTYYVQMNASMKNSKYYDGNRYKINIYDGCASYLNYVHGSSIVNEESTSIKIVKKCEMGAAGFEFTIKGIDANNKNINKKAVTVADKSNKNIGYITLTDIPVGRYTVTETQKRGYKPVSPKTVTLVAGKVETVEFTNIPITENLKILKTVSEGKLNGWLFKIDGPTMPNGVKFTKTSVTDANGQILVPVYEGTYTITEIPNQTNQGYYCDGATSKKVTVSFSDSKTTYNVSFKNILREFKILKTDMYLFPMDKVEFGVYKTKNDAIKDTNRIKTLITNKSGVAIFKGFGNDVYFIKETKTYPGYQISNEVFELNNKTGNFRNKPSNDYDWEVTNYFNPPVPTGLHSISQGLEVLLPLTALGIGAFLIYKKRKNKS